MALLMSAAQGGGKHPSRIEALKKAVKACVEQLESRLLLSGSSASLPTRFPAAIIIKSAASASPTATATVSNVYAAGGSSYTFTVTYQSTVPIVVSNLDNFDVRV